MDSAGTGTVAFVVSVTGLRQALRGLPTPRHTKTSIYGPLFQENLTIHLSLAQAITASPLPYDMHLAATTIRTAETAFVPYIKTNAVRISDHFFRRRLGYARLSISITAQTVAHVCYVPLV